MVVAPVRPTPMALLYTNTDTHILMQADVHVSTIRRTDSHTHTHSYTHNTHIHVVHLLSDILLSIPFITKYDHLDNCCGVILETESRGREQRHNGGSMCM